MLLLGFQEVATELYVARRKRLISYEEVERTMATYAEAFDRVLGAPLGTSNLGDEAVMREWFG